MRSYRWALDRVTGDLVARGRDGRSYSIAEVEAAEEAAVRGDAAALELLRQVELRAADQAGA
jgi:hypothetical protein